MENINKEIREIYETVHRMKKTKSRLDELNSMLQQKQGKLAQLKKVLDKEALDVEKLEKLSVKSMFHKVLGNEEDQIEKERQEYLHAALKYNGAVQEIDTLLFEKKLLDEKLLENAGLDERLRVLMHQKEAHLKQYNQEAAYKLVHLDKKWSDCRIVLKDISEALDAGMRVVQTLDLIIQDLKLTRQWGQWDMSGRGGYSNFQKRSYIDRARQRAFQANRLLGLFEKEFSDVYKENELDMNVEINLDSFSQFLDVFFDNLITDWIVQRKINNALAGVTNIRSKVVHHINTLKAEIPKIDAEINSLKIDRERVILQA